MTARLLILLPSPPQPWPCRQYCLHRWRSMILMLTQRKLINEEQDEIISASPPSLPSPPSSTSSRSSTTHSQVLRILNVAGQCNPCLPLNFYLASSAI
ncbi:hypothetical protein FCV25MIE_19158 [Fagus crenata]